MSDKRVGYIILAASLVIMVSLLVYSIALLAFPKETRVISFSRISNLRVDDPVKIQGKIVGRIKSLTGEGHRVLVTLELTETIHIHEGYWIYSTDKGILGDRLIVIKPGNSAGPLIEKSDTLRGNFYPGMSDVLGRAWKLKDFFTAFKVNAGILLSGTKEKPSLVSTFTEIISEIDTFSNKLYTTALFLYAELEPGIDSLNAVIAFADGLIQDMKNIVPHKITAVEKQVETLAAFLEKLDSIVNTLSGIILQIKDNGLIPSDHITSLLKQLKEIHDLLEELLAGTTQLKLKIKLGF
jgi:ABC-type transporter Mla subunit MlaD